MTRKLGWLVMMAALTLPAAAGELGTLSGYVKNSSGVPQLGAMVEVYGPNAAAKTLFTDARGYYSVAGLVAGMYQVKVTAASFLPSLREKVQVRTGASVLINVTLNTLFEALQLVPSRRTQVEEDEEWKWTLRSMTNRPILRVVDEVPLVVVSSSDSGNDRALKARVAFLAGADSEGLGSSAGMTTAFSVERSMFGTGTMSLDGNVYGEAGSAPGAVVRAGYSRRMPDGSEPKVTITARRFSTSQLTAHDVVLQALALSLSDSFSVSDFLDLSLGTELQSIQLGERSSAVHPFGSAVFHVSPNTVVEYQYATFEPNTRDAKGFESAPADLSESGPRVSMTNWSPVLERAHHHELSVSRRVGRNKVQFAVYSDRVKDPAVAGTGESLPDSGAILQDVYAGTFSFTGRDFDTRGLRAVYERKLSSNMTATLDYAYGGVLDLAPYTSITEARDAMAIRQRHAVGYKMSGVLPKCKTKWIASYQWTSGPAITSVDMFNSGPGQSDPYLSLFLKQPIPGTGFMPGHMEALIDVRNLLAQGYVPVMGQDGRTLYLVQSARALRGGVSFTF